MKLRDAARGAKQETASRRSLTVNILGGRREALSAAVVLYQGSRPASEPTQVAAGRPPRGLRRGRQGRACGLDHDAVARQGCAWTRRAGPGPVADPESLARPTAATRDAPDRGAGLSRPGAGILRTATLDPVAEAGMGLVIARTDGALACVGDSGGPIVADGPRGPVLWGVASAVLASRSGPPSSDMVVIAPASRRIPSDGLRQGPPPAPRRPAAPSAPPRTARPAEPRRTSHP